MFKTIKNAWKIPELRKKMLFTVLVIIVFRLGAVIPVPFLDAAQLKAVMDSVAGTGSGTASTRQNRSARSDAIREYRYLAIPTDHGDLI